MAKQVVCTHCNAEYADCDYCRGLWTEIVPGFDVWLVENAEKGGYNSMVWDVTETYEEALDSAIDHWYDSWHSPGSWLSGDPEPFDRVGTVMLYEFNPNGQVIGEYTISNWVKE